MDANGDSKVFLAEMETKIAAFLQSQPCIGRQLSLLCQWGCWIQLFLLDSLLMLMQTGVLPSGGFREGP